MNRAIIDSVPGAEYFLLNGIKRPRTYEAMGVNLLANKKGVKLIPVTRAETTVQDTLLFDEYLINGQVPTSQDECISLLNEIVFKKGGGNGGGVAGVSEAYVANVITQLKGGVPVNYDTLKKLADELAAIRAIVGGTTADADGIINTVTELMNVLNTWPEGVNLFTLTQGKVAKDDIYNALDCIVSGKVADARQLKALNDLITALNTNKEDKANKGIPSGYAGLDQNGKLPKELQPLKTNGIVFSTDVNALNAVLEFDLNDLNKGSNSYVVLPTTTEIEKTVLVFAVGYSGYIGIKANQAGTDKLSGNANGIDGAAGSLFVYGRENYRFIHRGNGYWFYEKIESVDYNSIVSKTDVYNGLDYTLSGKVADARQLKALYDLLINKVDKIPGDRLITAAEITKLAGFGNMQIMPAPYLEKITPDSVLPSTTRNITLKGSFFTPTTTVAIAGQTVNSVTFLSDNELTVNITTGATEDIFNVTINNGLSVIFNNKLTISLGIVFIPTASDWTNLVSTPDISKSGIVSVSTNDIYQGGDWKTIPASVNFKLSCTAGISAYASNYDPLGQNGNFQLISVANSSIKFYMGFRKSGTTWGNARIWDYTGGGSGDGQGTIAFGDPTGKLITLERINGIWKFYVNTTLIKTFSLTVNENLLIRLKLINQEITNIKYIELP